MYPYSAIALTERAAAIRRVEMASMPLVYARFRAVWTTYMPGGYRATGSTVGPGSRRRSITRYWEGARGGRIEPGRRAKCDASAPTSPRLPNRGHGRFVEFD